MAQRYTTQLALRRMSEGKCPECGCFPEGHSGFGSGICNITDKGVAERLDQFVNDMKPSNGN